MEILVPELKKIVDDYDILLAGGVMIPVTIDKDAGDTIKIDGEGLFISLSPKPNRNNPEEFLPAEDITIFSRHILSIQHRQRALRVLTTEERNEWARVAQGDKTVH